MSNQPALLLYDGTCGFCAANVQFVLRHERKRTTLRFAALQSPIGAEVRDRHPEIEGVDSVIWVERSNGASSEQVFVRTAGVLRVLQYLGGVWRLLAGVFALVPRPIRDWGYDFIARHRHKLTRGGPACLIPSPDQRARFID